jgi:hypothetical protein
MRRTTRREQRRARHALLRQVISVGFALMIASAARTR